MTFTVPALTPPILYTIAEAAAALRVSEWTIRTWVRTGRIRSSRIAKTIRISQDAIDAVLRGV